MVMQYRTVKVFLWDTVITIRKKCLYSFRLDMDYHILHSSIQTLYYQARR